MTVAAQVPLYNSARKPLYNSARKPPCLSGAASNTVIWHCCPAEAPAERHKAQYAETDVPDVSINPRSYAGGLGRRAWLRGSLATMLAATGRGRDARGTASLRLGVLQFGTVQWLADVIRRNALDSAHGIVLRTTTLANNDAGRISLMADTTDVVVADWPFVATQRTAGTNLCFAPFSSASGAIMAPSGTRITGLADLKRKRLGVAGGPTDKSWILVLAAGRSTAATDLATEANVVYGAPPLLNAKLQQGELDAVLTFWNFSARLEAAGYRQVISVGDCASALGLPPALSLVGFVFHQEWAEQNRAEIDGFLAAAAEADRLLATSEAEWRAVRPLMDAPDDALFESLRRRFVAGIAHPSKAEQEQTAAKLFEIVLKTGGLRATGGLSALPSGIFWPPADAKG